MKTIYLCLTALLICACTGAPNPATQGPTTSQPIFFTSPSNNDVIPSGEPIIVRLRLSSGEEFTSFTLSANERAVRLEEVDENAWRSDPIDDVLLTFTPGQHTLTAYAETAEGNSYSRSITVYAEADGANPPPLANDIRITGVTISNIDTGLAYEWSDGTAPDIPIEDLQGNGIAFDVDYEGDIYSMSFSGDALEESTSVYTPNDFRIAINHEELPYRNGYYELRIRPNGIITGELVRGQGLDVVFHVLDSKLKTNTRTLNFLQALGGEQSSAANIIIENTGNRTGRYDIQGIPLWLSLSQDAGDVLPGESIAITAQADACLQALADNATLKILADGKESEVSINYECVDGAIFDLSLDRFYFNQAVPANDSQEDMEGADIELVSGRTGIARAFVTQRSDAAGGLPLVQLHYRTANGLEGSYDLTGPTTVPETIFEGVLEQTFNATLPADFFEPGTEYYVTVDPGNEIEERIENNNRYPQEGYMPLSIRDVPTLQLTLVPMVQNGETTLPELYEALIPDLIQRTMALMPLKDYDISIREQPFVFTRPTWGGALFELKSLQQIENPEGLYLGIVQKEIDEESRTAGRATIGGKVAVSLPHPDVIAHELGHNFGLRHAPCGGAVGTNPNYPHENAHINVWGYNIFSGFLKPPASPDFMSYCGPDWISAYHYEKILERRGGSLYPAATPNAQAFNKEFASEEDLLVINGVIDGPIISIEHMHSMFGIAQPVTQPNTNAASTPAAIAAPYVVQLANPAGVKLYQGVLTSNDIAHSEKKTFTVKIPTRNITADVARIMIARNGVIHLDKPWQPASTITFDAQRQSAKLSRIDAQRLRVEWQVESDISLWITDPQTGNLLAIDASGDVIVYSKSQQLELQYNQQGHAETQTLTVQEK